MKSTQDPRTLVLSNTHQYSVFITHCKVPNRHLRRRKWTIFGFFNWLGLRKQLIYYMWCGVFGHMRLRVTLFPVWPDGNLYSLRFDFSGAENLSRFVSTGQQCHRAVLQIHCIPLWIESYQGWKAHTAEGMAQWQCFGTCTFYCRRDLGCPQTGKTQISFIARETITGGKK